MLGYRLGGLGVIPVPTAVSAADEVWDTLFPQLLLGGLLVLADHHVVAVPTGELAGVTQRGEQGEGAMIARLLQSLADVVPDSLQSGSGSRSQRRPFGDFCRTRHDLETYY